MKKITLLVGALATFFTGYNQASIVANINLGSSASVSDKFI